MQYLDAISNMTEWSLFDSKANHLISQLPKSMLQPVTLKKPKIGWFYEDLQDFLKLTPPKDVLFITGHWNARVRSQVLSRVTGKFGLGVQNKTGQRPTEFCQENALVIANTLLQQHKRESTHGITGMSTCYSFELCIQMDTSFLFSFTFHFFFQLSVKSLQITILPSFCFYSGMVWNICNNNTWKIHIY